MCIFWGNSALAAERSLYGGVSYVHSYVDYKEPGVMTEEGLLKGVGADLLWRFNDVISLNLQGKFLSGELEYTGETFSGTPLKQTTEDIIREYRGLFQFKLNNFVPYAGYGYRYWKNDLVISYVRETTYYYLPIGLRYVWRPFYLSFEHREFLNGVNVSHMSDVDPSRNNVTLNQDKGRGYLIEAGLLARIKAFDFKFSVAYERWEIDDSDTASDGVDTLVEPHNSTNALTFSLGMFY
jgi:hypothetical protein